MSELLLMLLLMLLRNDTGEDRPRGPPPPRSPPPPPPPPPPLLLFAVTRTMGELAADGQSFTTDDSLEDVSEGRTIELVSQSLAPFIVHS